MSDFSAIKLGRMPPLAPDKSRRIAFASAFGTDLPDPAAERDWTCGETERPIFGNQEFGDCTCATIANNLVGELKAAYHKDLVPSMNDVLALYANFGFDPRRTQPNGYNPTDQGAVFEDVLTFVRKNGFLGHHLIGSVAIDPKSVVNIKRTIDWFGVACFGLELPMAWQTASAWDLSGYSSGSPDWQPNSWGGHEVCAERYDANGVYVWTWGKLVYLTWEAIALYCDEVDAPIWASWIKSGNTPAGLSLDTLEQRQREIESH